MKSVQISRYGGPDVLRLEEVEAPTPKAGEVLVRVVAASVNSADWHLMRGDPWPLRLAMGPFRPKIKAMGADAAGVIEAIGPGVTALAPGDEVFGDLSSCGFGAFAEYVAAPATAWQLKPARPSFAEAAAIPMAAVTALKGLRDVGEVRSGQRVLVVGAAGGVGSFAVQIARALGAEVTALCSAAKADALAPLGASRIIDFENLDASNPGSGSPETYDVIFDAAAYRSAFSYAKHLRAKGKYVLAGGATTQLARTGLFGPVVKAFTGKSFATYLSTPNAPDLAAITALVESGQVKPLIDRSFPLSNVEDAMRHMEGRRTRGKIIITGPT